MELSRTDCVVCVTYILQRSCQCRQGDEGVSMSPTQRAVDNYADSVREVAVILAAYLTASPRAPVYLLGAAPICPTYHTLVLTSGSVAFHSGLLWL